MNPKWQTTIVKSGKRQYEHELYLEISWRSLRESNPSFQIENFLRTSTASMGCALSGHKTEPNDSKGLGGECKTKTGASDVNHSPTELMGKPRTAVPTLPGVSKAL